MSLKIGTYQRFKTITNSTESEGTEDLTQGDATDGNLVINLPPAALIPEKILDFIEIDSGSNYIQITPVGTDTIGGATSIKLHSKNDRIRMMSVNSGWTLQAVSIAPTVQTFTSGTNQTYTTPAGVKYIRVRALGGGGGGGGGQSGTTSISGQGGAGGGYCEATIISPEATYSYTVGTGGSGGSGGSGVGAGAKGGDGVLIIEEYY